MRAFSLVALLSFVSSAILLGHAAAVPAGVLAARQLLSPDESSLGSLDPVPADLTSSEPTVTNDVPVAVPDSDDLLSSSQLGGSDIDPVTALTNGDGAGLLKLKKRQLLDLSNALNNDLDNDSVASSSDGQLVDLSNAANNDGDSGNLLRSKKRQLLDASNAANSDGDNDDILKLKKKRQDTSNLLNLGGLDLGNVL